MDLSDDLPSSRRPLFFPVVIATVFLSVIGLSAGLVLSSQDKDQGQPTPPAAAFTTAPASPASTAEPCLKEAQAAAQRAGATGVLRLEFRLRASRSTVWICSDEAGRLYYHANKGGEAAEWAEGKTALFLSDVQHDGDGYEVKATDGTLFSINSERLRIVHKDGTVETQKAAD